MDNKDVQGVATYHFALHIEDVASGTHIRQGNDTQIVVANGTEGKGLIEQCHINASQVGRLGHEVFIASTTQQRTTGKVEKARIILHLNQCHKVGHSLLLTRKNLLSDIVQFTPIAPWRPLSLPFWCPFHILL